MSRPALTANGTVSLPFHNDEKRIPELYWYKADNYCNPGYPAAYERELEAYPESVLEAG